jgi:cyclase
MKQGYDVELLARLSETVNVPVIASGGAGSMDHMRDALVSGHADAVLAASMFHFRELSILQLKQYLRSEGVPVRL